MVALMDIAGVFYVYKDPKEVCNLYFNYLLIAKGDEIIQMIHLGIGASSLENR